MAAISRRLALRLVVVAVVLALVAVAVVVGVRTLRDEPDTALARAFALAPDDALRYSWTDWGGVRDELGLDLDADSPIGDVQELLDRGFDADLTATTALRESALSMQERLGFSPASIEWELFSQSTAASVVLVGLPEEDVEARVESIAEQLRVLGYAEPEKPDGVWEGDPVIITRAGDLTPQLQFVALDAERGVVVTSDTLSGAEAGVAAVRAEEEPPADLAAVVADAGEPLAASVYTGEQACTALSMEQADTVDQDQAAQLLDAAGAVTPVRGFALGILPDGEGRLSMSFDTEAEARTNADTRATLAAGPAPGQGGSFADRFTLGAVTARERVVRMDLSPVEGTFLLSDLATGPLLVATC
ncbi:hypothetical protein [Nocardioides nanhaiensis]|uniref:Peptidoglycan binding domain-containing protein n=1 Tax=Nocardioides nanhaiensis TaxID=1476871 RepID=A0ABP8VUW7_9ACTN